MKPMRAQGQGWKGWKRKDSLQCSELLPGSHNKPQSQFASSLFQTQTWPLL